VHILSEAPWNLKTPLFFSRFFSSHGALSIDRPSFSGCCGTSPSFSLPPSFFSTACPSCGKRPCRISDVGVPDRNVPVLFPPSPALEDTVTSGKGYSRFYEEADLFSFFHLLFPSPPLKVVMTRCLPFREGRPLCPAHTHRASPPLHQSLEASFLFLAIVNRTPLLAY